MITPMIGSYHSDGDTKITPVCVPNLPLPKSSPYFGPGVQGDLFWSGSESEGYNVWNAFKDEVTPTPPRLRTWPALVMTILLFEN